ncbi:hypothetical protein llap_18858 [Limosa lapponica baueri]|uniref:Uncharacterized protein n=1 Tax=Limosa lapponica baueri TaxID=1758121 RepID=A0A2I0TAL7_LIMLA|nr:hypothetical protein llap_18858 [Limosa lapponica baueri]
MLQQRFWVLVVLKGLMVNLVFLASLVTLVLQGILPTQDQMDLAGVQWVQEVLKVSKESKVVLAQQAHLVNLGIQDLWGLEAFLELLVSQVSRVTGENLDQQVPWVQRVL